MPKLERIVQYKAHGFEHFGSIFTMPLLKMLFKLTAVLWTLLACAMAKSLLIVEKSRIDSFSSLLQSLKKLEMDIEVVHSTQIPALFSGTDLLFHNLILLSNSYKSTFALNVKTL